MYIALPSSHPTVSLINAIVNYQSNALNKPNPTKIPFKISCFLSRVINSTPIHIYNKLIVNNFPLVELSIQI